MKKHRGAPLRSALAGAVTLLSAGAACHKEVPPAQGPTPPAGQVWLSPRQVVDARIDAQPLVMRDIDETIETSGRVALDDLLSSHVFSPVTGRVVSIDPTNGQLGAVVTKGAPLAIIESPDIGSAMGDLRKAEANFIAAQHDYERKKRLYDLKAASAADLEASEDNYRTARAELERARQKTLLFRTGDVDFVTQRYTLASPIDGEVLMRQINPGIEVTGQYSNGASQEVFTIGKLDELWLLADLYEMDVARVDVGMPVAVTLVTFPGKVFRGRIDWISGTLDPATRTAKVRVTFENPEHLLRPEMFATVQISVNRRNVLAIPHSAVLRLGESKVVFVELGQQDGYVKFSRVDVDVDERQSGQWLEVKGGPEAGQKVVVSGAILLSQSL